MKKKYTKRQIQEAIRYWTKRLAVLEGRNVAGRRGRLVRETTEGSPSAEALQKLAAAGIRTAGRSGRNLVYVYANDENKAQSAADRLNAAGMEASVFEFEGDGVFSLYVTSPENGDFAGDIRNGVIETLREEYPDATDEQIEDAVEKAFDNGDQVANAIEDDPDNAADIWIETAENYLNR